MRSCKNCGVELENNMNFCPLCGEPVIDESTENIEYIEIRKRQQEEKRLTDYQKLTRDEKRKLFWEISGIILISGIFVTLIIDFIGDYSISWSKYPLLVCAVAFINISLISFWYQRIFLLLSLSFFSTSALLIILDMFNGSIGWGVKLGIPLLLAAYIIVFILVLLIRLASKRGLNIIAYSFIAAGLLSICTEGIISLYTQSHFHLEWSIVTMASVVPVAALLLFIHFRLKKGIDLKRFFHI